MDIMNSDLLTTTFICPFMKIKLEAACSLRTCPYNKDTVTSNCMWEYISSKNSISLMELALISKQNKTDLKKILDRAKFKLVKTVLDRKLAIYSSKINYCYKCGKAYRLRKLRMKANYVCKDKCLNINCKLKCKLDSIYKKPISHVLIILASSANTGLIARFLKVSNRSIKELYIEIFGNMNLLKK